MKNIDQLKKQKTEIVGKINQAVKEGDEEGFSQAFLEYTDILQEAVMAEAKGLVQAADNQVLAGRGARALTSEENSFYQKLAEVMGANNPKQAIADNDMELVLPTTVIDAVFEDLTEEHPLLEAINFMPTSVLTEILVNKQDNRQLAVWGKLTDEIVKELSAGFEKFDLSQTKLSAFIPVGKAMIDLGPAWLDRYVRTILQESVSNGLEKGIIDGTGLDEPCGMRRDPNTALDPTDGYSLLTLETLEEISPASYGELIAGLVKTKDGLYRKVDKVIFICNPADYLTKVMPATTFQRPDGTWANNIFPFPTEVIQSVYVPEDEAIIGIANKFFMGLGTSKGGKIEYSDHYRFLEDERVFLTKLYGTGQPLDSLSFKRVDIANLERFIPTIKTVDETTPEA